MEKKTLLLIIVLALTIFVPVSSADCEIDYLSGDDVYYEVEGISGNPYTPGERINLTYHIYPSDISNSELDGDCGIYRYYDVYTILEQSNITATISYVSGETETRPLPSDLYEQFGNGMHLSVSVPDSTGIKEIKIGASGYLPSTYSDELTILKLDISHADRGILPPVQLVAVENSNRIAAEETSPPDQHPSPSDHQINPTEQIENLELYIEPAYVEAQPGDTVNYTVTINWTPSDWKGDLRFCGTLSAAGFEKSFDLQPVKPSKVPPIENEVPVTLPENIPPFNYSVNLTINAGSQKANDETRIKVSSSTTEITPGFGAVLGVTGLFAGLFLIKRKK